MFGGDEIEEDSEENIEQSEEDIDEESVDSFLTTFEAHEK